MATAAVPSFALDPSDCRLLAEPHPVFNHLREADPVHWSDHGYWVVSRYEDVRAVVMDRVNFGQGDFVRNIQLLYGPDFDVLSHSSYQWLSEVFVFQDPPRHTRLRGLVTQALTARRVQAMRPRIQEITDALIDRHLARGEMELIHDFAYRLPTLVMCDMLGISEEEADDALLAKLNQAIADSFLVLEMRALPPGELALANRQIDYLEEFFGGIFERRRRHPQDDLATALLHAREGGEGLSEREMTTVAIGLFGAGFETTAHMIGNGVLTLHRHPGEWQRLVADPGLAASATEEILRFESSLTATYRTAFNDVTIGGRTIKAGERVLALTAAANRDPGVYSNPDRFDIGRREAGQLSFGGGIHFCVGAQLARLEGEIALATLARRLPGMRVDTAAPAWRGLLFRGLERLPVRWPLPA
ncbi:cytochrome P450 [Sphingomonas astaxanthinifaciens]|uniref:Cytochrome P450 n=1 Tax=Sphingomonas astaxanthinifaciens DSM 22298 TaxID=1123267 RepID=A0ABQ5Z1M4_9SPHN|nr:cytochrome P450 [Sphingomonas astaxanthinifaciens]GLR46664.1 cytochrome P450 [Sphingomonas astaxanthinifaciens DSM 22298]